MASKLRTPRFASEDHEAQWWSNHRADLSKAFEEAATRGELRTGLAARCARERTAGTTPTTTIRLDPRDISRARTLAAKRGLRYQTYLKMLIHAALDEEGKRAS